MQLCIVLQVFVRGFYLWASPLGFPCDYTASFLVDDAVFHHKGDVLQRPDVLQRITGHRDHVCEVSGLQRTDLSFPTEQLCAIRQDPPAERRAADMPYFTMSTNSRA